MLIHHLQEACPSVSIRFYNTEFSLDVHFVSPAPVPSPGNAGLQPGPRSHAGAWRSQEKPERTGSVFMKQTSSLASLSAPNVWIVSRRDDLLWFQGSVLAGVLLLMFFSLAPSLREANYTPGNAVVLVLLL